MPLAAGGMARIYIGRTTGIGSFERHVVLKMITPERANDQTAVQMFLDEARLAASLNHQNVAQVFEVGEDAGIHYLAMEYVHGQDLRALLAKAGSQGTRVPLELALTVVAGAASGLNHAHERRGPDGVPLGIVHRDVSPSNIMIGYDGSVKLLDFGIAKATARSIETQSGIIKGKFAYMAPEQCRGRDVDRRSDVFSLGIILYEITTQHRCFRADSDFDTMHRIVTGDVVRPTRLVQGYPQALEAIVMKALAVDATQRYQSAGALLEALEAFAVAARMSLSTMSLGRFMREMFGDLTEPWLSQAGHAQQAEKPKESTISSTDGSGSGASIVTTGVEPVVEPDADAEQLAMDELQAQATIIDLPRGGGEENEADPSPVAWNAKSYPALQPSFETTPPPLPPPATAPNQDAAAPQPQALAVSPPVPSPMQASPAEPAPFPTGPGGDAAPAQRAVTAPTLPGYDGALEIPATADADPASPGYVPPADAGDDLNLQPDRRPLFIGLGVVALGLIILLVAVLGGGGNKAETTKDRALTPGSAESATAVDSAAKEPIEPAIAPVKTPDPTNPGKAPTNSGSATTNQLPATGSAAPPPHTESIALHVVSDPPGADVLLAGKPIGTTPLTTKIQRGTGLATLTIHKAKYQDVTTPIDLTSDLFTKEVALQKIAEAPAPAPKPEMITVKVTSTPAGAEVMLGGKTLGTTPLDVKVKRGGSSTIVVRHPKYQDATTKVDLGTDVKRDLTLKKVPERAVETPKRPSCQPPGQVDPFDPRPPCKS